MKCFWGYLISVTSVLQRELLYFEYRYLALETIFLDYNRIYFVYLPLFCPFGGKSLKIWGIPHFFGNICDSYESL